MRILHTADWHLGRVFHRTSLLEEQRFALEQIVGLADAVRPDVVLVAGDVYDRAVPPAGAMGLLDDVFVKLVVERKIPTIVIAGNHDSGDRLVFGARLLAERALHLRGPVLEDHAPIVLRDEHGPVAFYALPYPEPARLRGRLELSATDHRTAMRALVERMLQDRPPGVRSILVSHALVEGGRASESERPLCLGPESMVPTSCFESFDYVALGHLHKAQALGRGRIHYAGSIYPYAFSEGEDAKSVTLVELDARGLARTERLPLPASRRVRVIEGTMDELLAQGEQGEVCEDYLRVRLLDRGPVVGAVARLRLFYPNLLEIDRPHLSDVPAAGRVDPRDRLDGSRRERGTIEQFGAFYEHVSGERLPADLAAELERVLARVPVDPN